MSRELIQQQIEEFIRTHFEVVADDPYLSDSINLWEEGYIDSIGIVELVAFLESNFSIELPEAMLFSPNFASIAGLTKIVESLK